MKAAIAVHDLGKLYRRYDANRPRTLQESVIKGMRGLSSQAAFWALRHVDLEVLPGRVIGVIGPNGAGKSTLLRLVGGIGSPDEGHLEVRGRVGSLLDLGIGFHPDLTGRENVMISSVISGLTRQQVRRRFDEIVAFAELEEFIDSPLRTYSSGMQMRLGFAVAVHTAPDVLLIDEVLTVGDIAFQHKCFEKVVSFRDQGGAILVVSHDLDVLRDLCDRVLWLEHGQTAAYGSAQETIDAYLRHSAVGAD